MHSMKLRVFALMLLTLPFGGANGCGDPWALDDGSNLPATCQGSGGDDGAGGDGAGGDTGVGGAPDDSSSTGAGAGPSTSNAGVGAGPSSGDTGVGAGPGARGRVAPAHPRRGRGHHRGGLGTAADAICPGMPPMMGLIPKWQPLTTAKLRWIAAQTNIGGSNLQTGIQQSRTIGLAFEAWVLTTIGLYPEPPNPGRNKMLFMSPQRQMKNMANGGLPASVIPEFVGDQTTTQVDLGAMTVNKVVFPQSAFFEVKAVTGAITPSTSRWQILGLLDVARSAMPLPGTTVPPPAVVFITTGGTTISTTGSTSSPGVVAQATAWGVGVWQRKVYYDAHSADPNNPDLRLEDATCLTPTLYGAWSSYKVNTGPWAVSPLTSLTIPLTSVAVPGDPDPAEVD